ncbi:MAG: acyloxyacyl hydrolase [Planctomycetota bacterium]
MPAAQAVALVIILSTLAAAARAQSDAGPHATRASGSASEPQQLSLLTLQEPDLRVGDPMPSGAEPYGLRGSMRFTAGLRGAQDDETNTDISLFAQQTWFVVDDLEIGAELAAWWIVQGDDTVGGSTSLVIRYHFYQQPSFSLFAEAAIGAFLAGDNVPDDGTSFGLMPRGGVGSSIRIGETGTRLLLGLHWHHISNARLNGEARNPSRDSIAAYAAISLPF